MRETRKGVVEPDYFAEPEKRGVLNHILIGKAYPNNKRIL